MVCALACVVLHLRTLTYPTADFGEATYVDYAVHHRFALTERICHDRLRHFNNLPPVGVMMGYERLVAAMTRRFGVGLFAARGVSLIAGLAAYLLLVGVMLAVGASIPSMAVVVCSAFSWLFFFSLHSARPEGVIVLLLCATFAWAVMGWNPAMGFIVGLAGGLGASVYPAAVFVVVTGVILMIVRETSTSTGLRRYAAWGVGIAIGGCCALFLNDWDQFAQFLALSRHSTHAIHDPSLIAIFRRPLAPVFTAWELLLPDVLRRNGFYVPLLACLVTLAMVQLRRWSALSTVERAVVGIVAVLPLAYGCVAITHNPVYLIYLLPWSLWAAGNAASRLWRGDFKLTPTDVWLFSCIGLWTWLLGDPMSPTIYALPIYMGAAVYAARRRPWFTIGSGALLLALALYRFDVPATAVVFASHRGALHPLATVGAIVAPWLLMRRLSPLAWGRGLCVYAVILYGGFLKTDIARMRNDYPASQAVAPYVRRVASLPKASVAAPGVFWLYDPSLDLQAVEAYGYFNHVAVDVGYAFTDFRPARVVWSKNAGNFLWETLYQGGGTMQPMDDLNKASGDYAAWSVRYRHEI